MSLFYGMETNASARTAQRLVMDVISNNIANACTTKTAEGGPFKRKIALLMEREGNGQYETGNGVRVTNIVEDITPPKMVYAPDHPDANQDGYVSMPNGDTVKEMVDMALASKNYQANVTAFNEGKQMALKALELGK